MTEPKKFSELAVLKQVAYDRAIHPIARKNALVILASSGKPGRQALDEFVSSNCEPALREFAKKAMAKFKDKSDGSTWEKEGAP